MAFSWVKARRKQAIEARLDARFLNALASQSLLYATDEKGKSVRCTKARAWKGRVQAKRLDTGQWIDIEAASTKIA